MKFLQAAVLSAICVGYVTASYLGYVGYDGLHRAIDEGRLDIAVDLVKQDEALGEEGVRCVIRKNASDPDLIANFVNRTNQANARTLKELWRESPIETAEQVLEKVDFPQHALVDLASSWVAGYYPETFLVLLNKIVTPEDQENAVENAIERLVRSNKRTRPLLNALKGKTFRSEHLEHLAIQKAFMEGVKSDRVSLLPIDICEHAAITPELYADALIVTAAWGWYAMRQLLLKNADKYDLEAVKEKAGYAGLDSWFRSAIEVALKTAAPGGTRTRAYDIQTVEKARETFDELGHPGISEDVFNIIGDSVMRDPPKRREGQAAPTKAPKNIASDVTSTSTEIEGSGDIGSGRVGYVTASYRSHGGPDGLRRAIDEGRLDIAVEFVKQDKTLGEDRLRYVIEKDDPDLIASFISQTSQANSSTLKKLWNKTSTETFKKVLDKVDFPQQALVDVVSSSGMGAYPETFLVLLNKIVKPEDQETAVEKAIEDLVGMRIGPSPLLNALKGKTFRSERLEYLAIQKAFMEGVKRGIVDSLLTDICNHAAITPELYADALIATAELWEYHPMRHLLLRQADKYDLEAVKEKAGYADLIPKFRKDIENALKTAAPGGTRTRAYDIQTVEKAEETFNELGSSGISEDPLSIVGDFVALDAPARREGQTVSTKAPERVASDVTSTSTKTEGSEGIGSERVSED